MGAVIAVILSGFLTGALARLAVPGPDPMPIWLTVAIGLVGSAIGGGIGAAASNNPYVISFASLTAAIILVIAYRRFVQKRPLTGPDALRFPERGFGVDRYREQLERAGVDPDRGPLAGAAAARATPPAGAEETTAPEILGKLSDLHDEGVLTDEEYETARTRYLETLR